MTISEINHNTTSSNHVEIFAIRETSRECVLLRSLTQYICEICGLSHSKNFLMILYEENTSCTTQIKGGYI